MMQSLVKTTSHGRRMSMFLSVVVFVGVTANFQLTILHTNDIHARIEETDKNSAPCTPELQVQGQCFGGAARIRTMVNEKRKQYPDQTLLLDAGDQFQGTLWFYVFGGNVSALFMNLIGYNAMAIGNHEFDSGIEGLAPFARSLKFPLLSSNINVSNTPLLADIVKKSTVAEVKSHMIGIVGYTTTETPYISSPGTVTFSQELAAVQAQIDLLVSQGINKIIALGHSGFAIDIDLAKNLKNVDVVVGGHTNTFLYNGTSPSNEKPQGVYPTLVQNIHNGRDVLVVQDYAYGKYLGELHVTFNDAGEVIRWSGNPILLDNSVPKDNETMALIQKYLPEIEKLKVSVVGETRVDLMADRVLCRTTECNLGNLVADAMVHQNLRHTDPDSWSDVGIAIVNAGGFRASIPKGNITMEKIVFVQPFRNTVDIIEILGKTLIDILEYGASKWTQNQDEAFGGFLQVSGLQITYDISRPVGQRVHQVLAVCTKCRVPKLELLDPQKTYRILASSYIIGGGDGYSMLPDNILNILPVGYLDSDILLNYIKKFSPITTGLQGRIQHLSEKPEPSKCDSTGEASFLSTNTPIFIISFISFWLIVYTR